jgi:hypothetical protein
MAVYYLGRVSLDAYQFYFLAYQFRQGKNAAGSNLAASFPKGLKFLSGNNNARSYDANTMTYGNDMYLGVPIANRVTFAWVYYNKLRPETHYMSDTNW